MKFISGLAAVALAATTLAQPASAATTTSPTGIAGDYIASQLTAGLAIGDYGADIGLSIDAGLALEAIGRTATAELVGDSIAPALVTSEAYPYGYARSDEGALDGRYANATAKAAAFTQRLGRDAGTTYPEIDLIAQLEELTSDTTGEIADDSIYGNYENTIGQSFAVEALTVAGSSEAGAATGALLAQQCPAGFFRLTLDTTACADATDAPNPDVTALAVISLVESASTAPGVAAAVDKAADWLESIQLADGSLEGDAWTPGSNSNSTGLAGWALGRVGRTASAADAAAWTRGVQAADPGACASKAPTGGIAYNPGDLTEARAEGVTLKRDAWRRATFQAAPALLWAAPASSPLGITTPSTATATSTVTATVTGLAAGEYGCVSLGTTARFVKGTGADIAVPFALPAGTGSYTFSVTTLGDTKSSTTTVPAPVTPTPTPTPSPAPAALTPVVGELTASKVERVSNNTVRLTVSCHSAQACDGKVKIRSKHKVELANGQVRKLLLAKAEYSVAPGANATVKLKLQRPARKVLGERRLRVVATQTARGAEPATAAFWLRRK
ncbi:hypothetical protein SAMN05192575_102373 [Nocardioides alpinus]|uniref:Ig-like domain (Group 3) n=1 Tax=Nocardioides alpinus TaxID=748909 RepID=A0A1I0XIK1_9ACTN|nr:hypothetical protein [Nocardioides alpinus]PKH44321.1 hypothetical protein CXG46_01880 [Nocardioides alpinus]SFA99783.1 hypothetical protein SAMN05192575_102373 [Nocardioides alpinus]